MGLLRDMFGASKEEIWRQLAAEIGADFEAGSWRRGSRVVARHGHWSITLDVYTVSSGKQTHVYTRLRAPYVNADGFRFEIYRKSIFTPLGKWLGMQDIEVGFPEFDDAFVIKSKDEARVRSLCANAGIRQLIAEQPHVHLVVRDDEGWFGSDFPEGVDELYFLSCGVIKDVDRLKRLFDLFAATLDQLTKMGSAYKSDPGVTLR